MFLGRYDPKAYRTVRSGCKQFKKARGVVWQQSHVTAKCELKSNMAAAIEQSL